MKINPILTTDIQWFNYSGQKELDIDSAHLKRKSKPAFLVQRANKGLRAIPNEDTETPTSLGIRPRLHINKLPLIHNKTEGERHICSAYSGIRRDPKTFLSLADSNLSSWPDGETVGQQHTPSALIATCINNKQNDGAISRHITYRCKHMNTKVLLEDPTLIVCH